MAIDHKYGRVTTEHGTFGEDEPVVVFRAQDKRLLDVLAYYHLVCQQAGSPNHHLEGILEARDKVEAWQADHHIRVPTSDTLAD
jgi:hypothetical protein